MKTVALFVHGLGGDAIKSWGKFPSLINLDPELSNTVKCDFYDFPTCVVRIPFLSKHYPSIQDLGDGLKTFVDNKFKTTDEIILVGHSLGTLVIRKYLIDIVARDDKHNIKKVMLIAPPNEGSNWADLGALVSWKHQQLKQLCKNSDFLDNLNDMWENLNIPNRFDIKCVRAGVDKVVSVASSKSVCRQIETENIIDKGHINVIKPKNANDLSFLILKNFILKQKKTQISDNLLNNLKSRVQRQKNNKKYIPDVFFEFNDIKDTARYIVDPVLFFRKIVDELAQFDVTTHNEFLKEVGWPTFEINTDEHSFDDLNISNVSYRSESLINYLEDIKTSLPNFKNRSLFPKLSDEQFKVMINNNPVGWRFVNILDSFIEKLTNLNKKCLLLTEKAGQGKTNLLCDFVENFIIRKNFLGVFLAGNEFNNIRNEDIENIIIKEISGFSEDRSFKECFEVIEDLCVRKNTTFTIIIDGLNENSEFEIFSQKLAKFIEKILQFNFVRIILTCRSEFFNERFSKDFRDPSFKEDLIFVENFMKSHRSDEDDSHIRYRVIQSYFDYFQVKNQIFNKVKLSLSKDFLLLRIFCEVYGHRSNPNPPTEQVYDIFKDDLFHEYFEYKYKSLEQSKSRYLRTEYKKIFSHILNYMLKNDQYINIPLAIFSSVDSELINTIFDEDIFFRKDLINDEKSTFANTEVVNFTFDEFRDYLLSDYLVHEGIDLEKYISDQEDSYSPVLEGIRKYLFFKSRRNRYREQLKFIAKSDQLSAIPGGLGLMTQQAILMAGGTPQTD